jgi:hypothetical protein
MHAPGDQMPLPPARRPGRPGTLVLGPKLLKTPFTQAIQRSPRCARKGAGPAFRSCDIVTQCRFAGHMVVLRVSELDAECIGSQEKPNVEHLLNLLSSCHVKSTLL